MKKTFVLLSVMLLAEYIIPSHAHAETTAIGIYPPIIEIKAKKNAHVNAPIVLVNESEKEVDISISIQGFDPSENSVTTPIFYPEKNTPKDLLLFIKNIQITDGTESINTVKLYPKESRSLYISFPVETADTHEFYFAVVAQAQVNTTNEPTTSTRVQISPGVSSLVFASLNERENLSPEISKFTTKFLHSASPIQFDLHVFNTGDSYKNVSGAITIYNMLGKETGKIPLKSLILTANKTRQLKNTNEEIISWNEPFPAGLYTARASVSYENSTTTAKEVRFIVLPLIPFFAVVIVLIILLGVILRVIRKLTLKEA